MSASPRERHRRCRDEADVWLNTLAESFAFRSHAPMSFVIVDTKGKPLRDVAGDLIILAMREEAARWTTRGERVEPYIPRRHDGDGTGGQS